jgi:hypothetical protein
MRSVDNTTNAAGLGARALTPEQEAERDKGLIAIAALALNNSAFSTPGLWAHAVVIARQGERPRATGKGDFAHWCVANDLHAQARECLRRKVRPGQVLVYLEADNEVTAVAGFIVFDFARALRKHGAQLTTEAR